MSHWAQETASPGSQKPGIPRFLLPCRCVRATRLGQGGPARATSLVAGTKGSALPCRGTQRADSSEGAGDISASCPLCHPQPGDVAPGSRGQAHVTQPSGCGAIQQHESAGSGGPSAPHPGRGPVPRPGLSAAPTPPRRAGRGGPGPARY